MKKIIYISHIYGAKDENRQKVENIVKLLIKKYPEYLFISPIHALGFMYDKVGYITGLDMCLDLLSICDENWVCIDDWVNSKGTIGEYCYSRGSNKPIHFVDNNGEFVL